MDPQPLTVIILKGKKRAGKSLSNTLINATIPTSLKKPKPSAYRSLDGDTTTAAGFHLATQDALLVILTVTHLSTALRILGVARFPIDRITFTRTGRRMRIFAWKIKPIKKSK